MIDPDRLKTAYFTARDALLAERIPAGHWVGELSTSALSTATAVMALHLANPFEHRDRIDAGIDWLADHQNDDGGWGDTIKSFSNISTTMLCRAALRLTGSDKERTATTEKVDEFLNLRAGRRPEQRAEAIRRRYGKDRTFSVPILMSCALAGLVPWNEVPRLPFEAAALPQSWYRFARMPVVSYALPALIAIGQCVHHHRGTWNPATMLLRRLTRGRTLNILRRIQPTSGGYLEATPLTSFVVMALASIRRRRRDSEKQVIEEGVRFLVNSMRPDGSWPIDTNLATWVTTLSVNALAAAGDLALLDTKNQIFAWLLKQQYKARHPYTGAAPGGWAWTDLPGGVPDCDDTAGAILALSKFALTPAPTREAEQWVASLQNRDGGFPTFCRGWGTLPFDRSGADLTAHALRAIGENQTALAFLTEQQRPDGSWLPLWFGNQHVKYDVNPAYGTSRVLAAYRDLSLTTTAECQRGVAFLLSAQNPDGGWGGDKDCPSSVEETALVVEVLIDLAPGEAVERGVAWLIDAVESGRFREPSPIGFYFAKLWYYEKLYPLIFTVAALGRAVPRLTSSPVAGSA
jgi:squalene-hopene/tetraprenyl-beta-curcumene cyclase